MKCCGILLLILMCTVSGCKYSSEKRAPGLGDFTEQDVQNFIAPGRTVAEITNRFGAPDYIRTNQYHQVIMHFRSGLPDTVRTNGYVFAGFHLWTTNGIAVRWSTSDWLKHEK